MNIILNPVYESLRGYLMNIADHFESGTEIHRGRNSIRTCQINGITLNIKRYGVPAFPNRVVYTFLRSPKGLRAFQYPQELIARGFESPEPVAYIEERRMGLISTSYFVSLQCPYTRRFYEFGNADINHCSDVITAFARFTARLHAAGIMHLDYSPGNILFDRIDGQWHFSLVDTNRMAFKPICIECGCANFARLWGQPPLFRLLAQEYAKARGGDPVRCEQWVMQARKKFWKRFSKRHIIKYDLNY